VTVPNSTYSCGAGGYFRPTNAEDGIYSVYPSPPLLYLDLNIWDRPKWVVPVLVCGIRTAAGRWESTMNSILFVLRIQIVIGLCAALLHAQAPEFTSEGVVNAASLSSVTGISSGSIVTIFGKNLSLETVTATSLPLPKQLGNTTVLMNGVAAPLFYVSPTQINAQMSVDVLNLEPVMISVNNGKETSRIVEAEGALHSPGIFTLDGSGCGTPVVVDALTWKFPSESESFAPGDLVTMFGTGATGSSTFPRVPPGEPAPPPRFTDPNNGIGWPLVDGIEAKILFNGWAPGMVGVDQINFQIPENTPEGCSVPLELWYNRGRSQQVPLRIKRDRGKCVDLPTPTGLNLTLIRNFSSGVNQSSTPDGAIVDFVSRFGPGPSFNNDFMTGPVFNDPSRYCYVGSTTIRQVRRPICPQFQVFDGTNYGKNPLNAGPITFSRAGGQPATLTPTTQNGKPVYPTQLVDGTFADGLNLISISGGPDVGAFQTSANLPPFRFLRDLSPGSVVDPPEAFGLWKFDWEGGDPDGLVVMSFSYPNTIGAYNCVEYTSKGTMLITGETSPFFTNENWFPKKGPLPAPLTFTVYSTFNNPASFNGGGLSIGGKLYYRYVYQFGGLVYK
jgi:uncharacterized protein (TIGR03437 family)